MNLHLLQGPAPAELGAALEEFEKQFRYPLGAGASFSISHGRDYVTFFQAMGEPAVVVAEHQGCVLATIAASARPVRLPDGQVKRAVYLGDLKVAPRARGGTVLGRLLGKLRSQLEAERLGYGVVMHGTGRTPFQYTGRLSIPPFTAVAQLLILAIATESAWPATGVEVVTPARFEQLQRELAPGGIVPAGGRPEVRSELSPLPLGGPGAAGLLEDTRKGKRLYLSPDQEMRAAHLSRLVFRHVEAGRELVRYAAQYCHQRGIPTLFLSLPERRAVGFLGGEFSFQPAPATVFAHGFESGHDWWVDSAEI